MVSRRKFIGQNLTLAAGACLASSLGCGTARKPDGMIMTVNGPIPASKLGFTLVHEHVMVDFIGATQTGKHRYNADDVYKTALPFLMDVRKHGCATFVDCTPAYVGRDVQILQRLSKETGLNMVTTTGYYGARKEQFYPQHMYTETAEQIAARWIAEYKNGIDGTDIKPGMIKCGVDNGPLTPAQRKTIEAAAITHLTTGLTIGVHTGNGAAAVEEMEILKAKGASLAAYIWIHAQNEKDASFHIAAAKQGAWISFDAVYPTDIDRYVEWAKLMKNEGLLQHVLFSQDSGWYHVGEPNGGEYEGYTTVFEKFLPALTRNGFTQEEIDLLFYTNPAEALAVKVRKL
jgi:predicted metal-dependent phosphotriesterase family hydrolase